MAISTYKKNLIYFENKQKNIYDKLASFETAVMQNLYQSRYEIIVKDGYFDVLELSSKKYLYGSDSHDYATLVSKSINFKRDSNSYETFRKITIKDSDLKKYELLGIIENNLSGVAPILNYIDRYKPTDAPLKKIEKFIFFGVGLGEHITKIDKKINAKSYLIVEDDLELFKLSLFTVAYYELALESELIFSVFDTKEEFAEIAELFLDNKFYYNHYIKYFLMLNHSEEKLEEFHIKIASQSHNLFFYNVILEQYLRPIKYLQNNFNFLNILHKYQLLSKKPIILLGAGPSLDKNIEWIKQNKNKFLIVALSATLSTLEHYNIKPTIVTHIDGFDDSANHFKKLNSMKFLENSIFLISARTPQSVMNYLTKENVYLFENGTSYKKVLGNLSAPCVGSTTYLLLLALGVDKLFLLGLDLSLDNETGSTHSVGHFQEKTLDFSSANIHEDTITFKDHLIKVAGNLRESVYTLPDWKLSIQSVSETSMGFKHESQIVYNLSDGARFSNTIALDINSLDTDSLKDLDKRSIYKKLSTEFMDNSSHKLNQDEINALKQRLKYAQKLKKTITNQGGKSFKKDDEFLNSLISLNKQCINSSEFAYDLSLVYQAYFKLIYTFIFDFFNFIELQDKVLHANKLNKLLVTQLLKIINIYIKELETV